MSELINQSSEEELITVTLTLDNDKVVECAVLTTYPAGEREYIALLPLDENGDPQAEDVYLYRYEEANGEPILDNIESEEENEIAANAFSEWLDAQDFDELEGEE